MSHLWEFTGIHVKKKSPTIYGYLLPLRTQLLGGIARVGTGNNKNQNMVEMVGK